MWRAHRNDCVSVWMRSVSLSPLLPTHMEWDTCRTHGSPLRPLLTPSPSPSLPLLEPHSASLPRHRSPPSLLAPLPPHCSPAPLSFPCSPAAALPHAFASARWLLWIAVQRYMGSMRLPPSMASCTRKMTGMKPPPSTTGRPTISARCASHGSDVHHVGSWVFIEVLKRGA
jgi:hypothetical protein